MTDAAFWGRVDRSGDCWLWTGSRTTAGYGNLWRDGQTVYAHRYAWEQHSGRRLEPGELVCHKCDNPLCVRPEHFFIGTKGDNNRDRVQKLRGQIGENHKGSRLTAEHVVRIRELYAQGWTQAQLAVDFGASQITVSRVVRRESWKQVA